MVRIGKLFKHVLKPSGSSSSSRGSVRRFLSTGQQKTQELLGRAQSRIANRGTLFDAASKPVLDSLEKDRRGVHRFDPMATGPIQTDQVRANLYLMIKTMALHDPKKVLEPAKKFLSQASAEPHYAPAEQVELVRRMVFEIEEKQKARAEHEKRQKELAQFDRALLSYGRFRQSSPAVLFRVLRGGPKLWRRIPDFADTFKKNKLQKMAALTNEIVALDQKVHAQEVEVNVCQAIAHENKKDEAANRNFFFERRKLDTLNAQRKELEHLFTKMESDFHHKVGWRYKWGVKFRKLFEK